MFEISQDFAQWLFQGASVSVQDFFACLITVGIGGLILCPFILILKLIIKK